jgi:YVTN family beta-propeller protein
MRSILKFSISILAGIVLGIMLAQMKDQNPCYLPPEVKEEKTSPQQEVIPKEEKVEGEEEKQIRAQEDIQLPLAEAPCHSCALNRIMEVADELPVPSETEPLTQQEKDVLKYGTREGIVDVSDDEVLKKEKLRQLEQMLELGENLTREQIEQFSRTKEEQLQLTFHNTSDKDRPITLWGTHKGKKLSPPTPEEVEDHEIRINTNTGVHPQGVVWNPANGFSYTANQLSNSVTIADKEGKVIHTVFLYPNTLPGSNSPVALTVCTNQHSPHYGKVYVVGSVANTITVIGLHFQIMGEILVGIRPIAIAFNPVNQLLYVVNMTSRNVSVINLNSGEVIQTLSAGIYPRAIEVNPVNGDVYIVNTGDHSVDVYDVNNLLVTNITGVGDQPASIVYHPDINKMCVVSKGSNQVILIDVTDYSLSNPILVGESPSGIAFNTGNRYLYVANRADQSISVIAPDLSIRATIPAPGINNGMASIPGAEVLYSGTSSNRIQVLGFAENSRVIKSDQDVEEISRYFLSNPAQINHLKLVLSGERRMNSFSVRKASTSGVVKQEVISLSNYHSPQMLLNVAEVTEMKNEILDNKSQWFFMLPAQQTLTMLISYKPLARESLMHKSYASIN